MVVQASLPSGFRDVGPEAFQERKYILDVLERYFELYGFSPLETPAIERLTTLLGKYGDEGEQLIFRVLHGDREEEKVPLFSQKGLRYDLTVPLARYVAQHRSELAFPFKRYQIQPVWRAERAQKGRYREFYQCDVDIIGCSSLYHEASLLVLVHEVLQTLGIKDFKICVNHRKWLYAMAKSVGMEGREELFCQALDKVEKIGMRDVSQLLLDYGVTIKDMKNLTSLLAMADESMEAYFDRLYETISPLAREGIDDIRKVRTYVSTLCKQALNAMCFVPTLARGISYYTGIIFEVKVAGAEVGSIVGGGRYDGLTDMFGLKGVPGVGLAFGLERIYDLMKARNLFSTERQATRVLVVPMESLCEEVGIDYVKKLRAKEIVAEFYPSGTRMKKAFSYAHKRGFPWVIVIGSKEMSENLVSVRNMRTGNQKLCKFEDAESMFLEEVIK